MATASSSPGAAPWPMVEGHGMSAAELWASRALELHVPDWRAPYDAHHPIALCGKRLNGDNELAVMHPRELRAYGPVACPDCKEAAGVIIFTLHEDDGVSVEGST